MKGRDEMVCVGAFIASDRMYVPGMRVAGDDPVLKTNGDKFEPAPPPDGTAIAVEGFMTAGKSGAVRMIQFGSELSADDPVVKAHPGMFAAGPVGELDLEGLGRAAAWNSAAAAKLRARDRKLSLEQATAEAAKRLRRAEALEAQAAAIRTKVTA